MKPARQSYRNEQKFIPKDFEDLGRIADGLVSLGYDPQSSRGLMGWLVNKKLGRPDDTAVGTRWKYRKMLSELEAFWGGPEPQRADAGHVPMLVLASVASVLGAVVAVLGHAHPALALPPIIRDSVKPEDELLERRNCCWEPPALLAA